MKLLSRFARPAAVVIATSCTLTACDGSKEPPIQLEAKLVSPHATIQDKDQLAANLVQQLNVKGLAPDKVRVAFDEDRHAHFFRLVGREQLPPALLKEVEEGLAKLDLDFTWRGKLIVEADAVADEILKTEQREFPVVASWHSARVEAVPVHVGLAFSLPGREIVFEDHGSPKSYACMLSFRPEQALPPVKGWLKSAAPDPADTSAKIYHAARPAREVSLPYRLSFSQPELATLEEPVVEEGSVSFQFALIDSSTATAPRMEGGDGPPVGGYEGPTDKCKRKLREAAPRIQDIMERSDKLHAVSSIEPARRIPFPRNR